jgi:hypothetical protein
MRGFVDDVFEKPGSRTGGRVSAKGLLNGKDIIVHSLGHANDNHLATVLREHIVG